MDKIKTILKNNKVIALLIMVALMVAIVLISMIVSYLMNNYLNEMFIAYISFVILFISYLMYRNILMIIE